MDKPFTTIPIDCVTPARSTAEAGSTRGISMQLVTRLSALSRALQVVRQLRAMEKRLVALQPNARRQLAAIAMREFQNASKSEFPHLYATPPDHKYHPWGTGTDIGLERMRSESLQVRLRGVALWLTVVYHETKDSQFAEIGR